MYNLHLSLAACMPKCLSRSFLEIRFYKLLGFTALRKANKTNKQIKKKKKKTQTARDRERDRDRDIDRGDQDDKKTY